MEIITLEEANDHLRLNLGVVATSPLTFEDDRIPALLVKITAAESIIRDYLKIGASVFASPPSFTTDQVEVIRAAVLLALSALWDDSPERTVGDYMAPTGTIALLLARLRDPTLA